MKSVQIIILFKKIQSVSRWIQGQLSQIQYFRYSFSVRVYFHCTLNTSNKVYRIETCWVFKIFTQTGNIYNYSTKHNIWHRSKNTWVALFVERLKKFPDFRYANSNISYFTSQEHDQIVDELRWTTIHHNVKFLL